MFVIFGSTEKVTYHELSKDKSMKQGPEEGRGFISANRLIDSLSVLHLGYNFHKAPAVKIDK